MFIYMVMTIFSIHLSKDTGIHLKIVYKYIGQFEFYLW